MVYGIWYMVYGIWYMVYGIWYMVYGIWYMVYGIWYMVYGIWYMVYGIWYMVYGRAPPVSGSSLYICHQHFKTSQSRIFKKYKLSSSGGNTIWKALLMLFPNSEDTKVLNLQEWSFAHRRKSGKFNLVKFSLQIQTLAIVWARRQV